MIGTTVVIVAAALAFLCSEDDADAVLNSCASWLSSAEGKCSDEVSLLLEKFPAATVSCQDGSLSKPEDRSSSSTSLVPAAPFLWHDMQQVNGWQPVALITPSKLRQVERRASPVSRYSVHRKTKDNDVSSLAWSWYRLLMSSSCTRLTVASTVKQKKKLSKNVQPLHTLNSEAPARM